MENLPEWQMGISNLYAFFVHFHSTLIYEGGAHGRDRTRNDGDLEAPALAIELRGQIYLLIISLMVSTNFETSTVFIKSRTDLCPCIRKHSTIATSISSVNPLGPCSRLNCAATHCSLVILLDHKGENIQSTHPEHQRRLQRTTNKPCIGHQDIEIPDTTISVAAYLLFQLFS